MVIESKRVTAGQVRVASQSQCSDTKLRVRDSAHRLPHVLLHGRNPLLISSSVFLQRKAATTTRAIAFIGFPAAGKLVVETTRSRCRVSSAITEPQLSNTVDLGSGKSSILEVECKPRRESARSHMRQLSSTTGSREHYRGKAMAESEGRGNQPTAA